MHQLLVFVFYFVKRYGEQNSNTFFISSDIRRTLHKQELSRHCCTREGERDTPLLIPCIRWLYATYLSYLNLRVKSETKMERSQPLESLPVANVVLQESQEDPCMYLHIHYLLLKCIQNVKVFTFHS